METSLSFTHESMEWSTIPYITPININFIFVFKWCFFSLPLSFLTNKSICLRDFDITIIPLYLFLRLLSENPLSSPPLIQFLLSPNTVPNMALHSSSNTAVVEGGINAVYLKERNAREMNAAMTNGRRSGGVWTIGANLFRDFGAHCLWAKKNQYNPSLTSREMAAASLRLLKNYGRSKNDLLLLLLFTGSIRRSKVREHLLPSACIFRSNCDTQYTIFAHLSPECQAGR